MTFRNTPADTQARPSLTVPSSTLRDAAGHPLASFLPTAQRHHDALHTKQLHRPRQHSPAQPRNVFLPSRPVRASSADARVSTPFQRDSQPTHGKSTLHTPSHCPHHPSSLTLLPFTAASPEARCPECQLVTVRRTRRVDRVVPPPVPYKLQPMRFVATDVVGDGSDVFRPRAHDYRWASLRHHPLHTDAVLVCDGSIVHSLIPRRQACYMRALLLQMWQSRHPQLWFYEGDVHAAVLAWCRSSPPADWPVPTRSNFRGQHHVFPDIDFVPEPNCFRLARLPHKPGPVPFAHPATSPFTSVTGFNSPLSVSGHAQHLQGDPNYPFLLNSLKYGFPYRSNTPMRSRPHRQRHSPLDNDTRTAAALLDEWLGGAFIPAPAGIPLRFAPLNPVVTNKLRLVADMSFGEGSLNEHSETGPITRARLAKLVTLARRILYMQRQRPGVHILIAKIDAVRAFRQVPSPVADFHKAAHHTRDGDVVHTRVALGAKLSSDLMSPLLTALSNLLNEQLSVFTDTYVDDMIVAMYEDEAEGNMRDILTFWSDLGWPVNPKKLLIEGTPSPSATVLGIGINADTSTIFVTPDRRNNILTIIGDWSTNCRAPRTQREAASLAGKLQHIAYVIPFGRTFLKRLYRHARNSTAAVPPSPELLSDLSWWSHALTTFNGHAFFTDNIDNVRIHRIQTDAAKFGGAVVSTTQHEFFTCQWSPQQLACLTTAHWEATMVVAALSHYGPTLPGGILHVLTDSSATVSTLTHLTCSDSTMFSLARLASLLQIQHSCRLVVDHIAGEDNGLADTPSRTGHMSPDAAHLFTRVQPTPPTSALLRSTLDLSLPLESIVTSSPQPASTTGNGTATSSTTPRLIWTPWNDLNSLVASSISPDGSRSTPKQKQASAPTSAQPEVTLPLSTASHSAATHC